MQFTLRSIFLAFVVFGSALGAFGPCGLIVGVIVVCGVVLLRTAGVSLRRAVLALLLTSVVILLCVPFVSVGRAPARRAQCGSNLRNIALAIYSYEKAYGSLPPACVLGPDGKPWHSWRVLILPFMEYGSIYRAYNFNEPWNGPNNSRLAASMPPEYVCPTNGPRPGNIRLTNYLALVGPRTMWTGAKPRRLDEVTDGLRDTISVAEVATGIPWMEPRDMSLDDLSAAGERDPKTNPLGAHFIDPGFLYGGESGITLVLCADGCVRPVRWPVPPEQLAPLMTVDGGETVDGGKLPWAPEGTRVHWPRVLSLAALAISTVLFWFSVHPRGGQDRKEAEPCDPDAA